LAAHRTGLVQVAIDRTENRQLINGMSITLFLAALLPGQPVAARSPFTGSWLMELASIEQPPVITTFSLKDGMFSRATGDPGFAVRADGRFHPVPSDPYVDAVSVTVQGPRRVHEIDRFGGKPVYSVTYDVAADGRTMTSQVIDLSKPDGKPIPGTTRYRRVGAAPRGMAPLNGRWQMVGVAATREHLTDRFRLEGNHFVVIRDGGAGYDAVIGGPPVPIAGEQAAARATITMPDDRTIVENVSVDGVPALTTTMTLSPDGQTIRVVGQRIKTGVTVSWTLHRQ
jgi:hypothetical protein